MNRKAVLIGFEYKNGKKLPGISVDLYQVYTFLKKLNWKDNEITVFTDIKKDEQTDILKAALLEKIVDSKILTFIEDLKEKKQYFEFNSLNHYNNFNSLFNNSEKVFIYYSGHSKDGNLILPNNSLVSLDSFRDNLKNRQIFLIMDCCEGGIKLPFVLNDKNYRLENENCFVKSEFICISSSLFNENSVISKTGSLFTRNLLTILETTLDLKNIKKKIKTGNISVSYPNLCSVFTFFYKNIDINININENFISIERSI